MINLNSLEYDYNDIKVKDSIRLSKEAKRLNLFEFLELYLDKITTLDLRQINQLLLQDVYSIIIKYLMEKFENGLLVNNPPLSPSDFLIQKPNYEEVIYKIDNYRFSNLALTLDRAKKVEKYCYLNNDKDLLSLYLLAGTCLKGLKEGTDTIINNDDSIELRNHINKLNELIGQVSYVKINLLLDFENLSIISNTNNYYVLDTEFFFYK
jgi:hypothetical protein